MTTRLYIIEEPHHPARLIEAGNASQAVRHVAKKIVASVAKAHDVARLMGDGVKVEKAGEEA